jgi:hypothetical protein
VDSEKGALEGNQGFELIVFFYSIHRLWPTIMLCWQWYWICCQWPWPKWNGYLDVIRRKNRSLVRFQITLAEVNKLPSVAHINHLHENDALWPLSSRFSNQLLIYKCKSLRSKICLLGFLHT